MKRVVFWVVVWVALMVGLAAGPGLWAAPDQNRARQTVPSPTPKLSPTTPLPSPTQPPPTRTSRPSAAQPVPTLTTTVESNIPTEEMPEPLLPPAGGRSIRLQFGFALMTFALLVLAARKWRVQ